MTLKRDRNLSADLDRILRRHDTPPEAAMETARDRVLRELKASPLRGFPTMTPTSTPAGSSRTVTRRLLAFGSVGAIAAALMVSVFLLKPESKARVFANVEITGNSLDRVAGGKSLPLRPGDPIGSGEVVRSGGSGTAVLSLEDGSRIEMNSSAQITFESAKDGVLVSLLEGSVIVNAVPQDAGHLYVETRDYLVSVIGTVFLVDTSIRGSRVAVIEGTVLVQHGAEARTVRGGEQMGTASSGSALPFTEQIQWSRNAPKHLELLRQSPPIQPASSAWSEVAGTVQFATGEHLAGTQVNLRLALGGDEKQGLVFTTETLPDGSYRFQKVPPGKHAISLPNTEAEERIVEVAPGTRVAGIDFLLPGPAREGGEAERSSPR
jgi:ferric-dicitrate binding protein FerR (iron transport regulator)